MESFLADYTENVNPELDYESKATYAGAFESMRSMFLLLGGALSFIRCVYETGAMPPSRNWMRQC